MSFTSQLVDFHTPRVGCDSEKGNSTAAPSRLPRNHLYNHNWSCNKSLSTATHTHTHVVAVVQTTGNGLLPDKTKAEPGVFGGICPLSLFTTIRRDLKGAAFCVVLNCVGSEGDEVGLGCC